MRRTAVVLLAMAGALLYPHAAGAQAAGPRLVFAGSGTNLPITRLPAEAFGRMRPEAVIGIPPSLGSSGGVRAAADGAITVGLVSRPLTEAEKSLGLTVRPYARTAVVIGVHLAVADDTITFDELVGVYRGTRTRWRDGREVIVLARQLGESTVEVLERAVPGFKDAYAGSIRAKRWTVLFTDQEMNRVLAKTADAIGLTDLGSITVERQPIKALRVNGVAPTPENVASGAYPLVKTLACVFRRETLSADARAFLEFVRSRDAEKILRANGYLPVE
jgi:phosphate transport system substrate-binding protein